MYSMTITWILKISIHKLCFEICIFEITVISPRGLWNEGIHLTPVLHYSDVLMSAMASQITSLTIVYSTVYSGTDQRKHQSSAPLAFVWGIHRWPVNSLHQGPVTPKRFPFDDIIMKAHHIMLWGRPYMQLPSQMWIVRWNKQCLNDTFLYLLVPTLDI